MTGACEAGRAPFWQALQEVKSALLAVLCFASATAFGCATARAPRPAVAPDALRGVTLSLPPPTDLRRSAGTGCGQVSSDVPLQTERTLVRAFSDAGARLLGGSQAREAEWTLAVSLATATVGAEYQGSPNQSARPPGEPQPDVPELFSNRGSLFNGDNGHATVSLEATLTRAGRLVWSGNVSGHAESVPCQQVQAKVREALEDAVDGLRAQVIEQIRRAPR